MGRMRLSTKYRYVHNVIKSVSLSIELKIEGYLFLFPSF